MAEARRSIFFGGRLVPQGLRSKLLWAFLLMSGVPLVMLLAVAAWFAFPSVRDFYQLERWFPMIANPTLSTWWLIALLALTVAISLLGGLYLTMKLVDPIIRLTHEAKQLAQGAVADVLPVTQSDELGDLTTSLNQLTSRIRDNMVELKQFGERTTQINIDIQKRVLMLSGLLQIGELISKGVQLDAVLDMIVEKLAMLEEHSFSFLCLQPIEDVPLTLRRGRGIAMSQLSGLTFDSSQVIIDTAHPPLPLIRGAWEQFDRPHLITQPVLVRNRVIGVLGVGNRQSSYYWNPEQVDLVAVFVKQAAMAIENDVLLKKTRALAVHDELTGIYNERHIRQRLEEEIKRAVRYQRPCAIAMFVLQNYARYRQRYGEPEAERALKAIAKLVQESVTEIDQVGRFNGNELVVLLPERNKREATLIAEQIRHRVARAFPSLAHLHDQLGVVSAVAENPVDGATGEALLGTATALIRHAMPEQPSTV